MTVNVTLNGTFTNPQFHYTGFDINGGDPSLTHTYANAGDFYITLLISDEPADESEFDSIFVEVKVPELPTFAVHNCANHQVSVEIKDDYYDFYRVDFNGLPADNQDVLPLSFSNPHNYGVQGTYPIIVTGVFNNAVDNCNSDNQQINTIDDIINPVFTSVETTRKDNNGTIALGFSTGDDIIYNLESSINGSEDFQFFSEVTGSQLDITGIDNTADYFCYRINTLDACNMVTILTDTPCSVNFAVQGTDGANRLTWQTDTIPAVGYEVLRDGSSIATITDPSIVFFDDTNIICNIEYVYNIQVNYRLVGLTRPTSLAADTAIISFETGTLPAVNFPFSTVQDNSVELTWSPPDTGQIPFRQYIIQKNLRNRKWNDIGVAQDTTFTDLDPSFFGSHAYRILYDDDCGNIATPSPATEPMIVEQTGTRGKIVTYGWNRYETWLTGIRTYFLERLDERGSIIEEFSVLSGRSKSVEFSQNDSQDKFIRIRAESLDQPALITYSNVITTILSTEMFLPNAFTPDGDNLNDVFLAKGPKVFNFKMEIYTRWGELIFVSEDVLNGWDGMLEGKEAPEGTYIYKIFYNDAETRSFDQSGSIILMRKG